MGDSLGEGKQRTTDWHVATLEMSKAINGVTKPICESHFAPPGANVAKAKSASGGVYASTSRTVGAPRPRAQRSCLRGRSMHMQRLRA
jgi:hypothetical protein